PLPLGLADHRSGPVRAAVVDQDQLEGRAARRQEPGGNRQRLGQPGFLVVAGHHQAEVHGALAYRVRGLLKTWTAYSGRTAIRRIRQGSTASRHSHSSWMRWRGRGARRARPAMKSREPPTPTA